MMVPGCVCRPVPPIAKPDPAAMAMDGAPSVSVPSAAAGGARARLPAIGE
jgi:hypothetical protein